MRDVDERVAAVQGRVRLIRRKRDRSVACAVAACAVLAFVGLMGMPVVSGQLAATFEGSSLFGATSLFGASVGGYVLVALVAAVVAVAVTVFLMRWLKPSRNDECGEKAEMPKDERGFDGDKAS